MEMVLCECFFMSVLPAQVLLQPWIFLILLSLLPFSFSTRLFGFNLFCLNAPISSFCLFCICSVQIQHSSKMVSFFLSFFFFHCRCSLFLDFLIGGFRVRR